ncbi:MAG: DUF2851 family protein [Dehalococcoidia bacterium]
MKSLAPVAKRVDLHEEGLWRTWASSSPGWGYLPASDGHRYRVLYPGRLNRGAGPDFLGALLLRSDGCLLKGDVEVHRSPYAWKTHGHATDPRYQKVLLHLVARGTRESNPHPPQVELAVILRFHESKDTPPFVGAIPTPALLHRWADARFRQRAALCARLITTLGPDGAIYQGLMEGMGYGANRTPMRLLAQAVPYRMLRRIALPYDQEERPKALAAVLLGCGGLLPHDGPLTEIWKGTGVGTVLTRDAWSLAGVRPTNRPERRLHGVALLLARWWGAGLAQGLRQATLDTPRALENALIVPSPSAKTALIGRQRAREVAVSIVLPFLWAWSLQRADSALRQASWACWKTFPPPEENALSRAMRALLPTHLPATARLQQGLLAWARRLGTPCAPPLS